MQQIENVDCQDYIIKSKKLLNSYIGYTYLDKIYYHTDNTK